MLLRLAGLILTEPNLPELEGHEYGYTLFESFIDINVSCSKSTPLLYLL